MNNTSANIPSINNAQKFNSFKSPAKAFFDIAGHRGCRGLMPENTIHAFIEALKLGVNTFGNGCSSVGRRAVGSIT